MYCDGHLERNGGQTYEYDLQRPLWTHIGTDIWLRRMCGDGKGYLVGSERNKIEANSAQLS